MKKSIPIIVILILVLAAIAFLLFRVFSEDTEASALRKLFYPPQWEEFDFKKREKSAHNAPFSIAPSLSDSNVYEAIKAASVDAGITSLVLPQDFDRIPAQSKYFSAVFKEILSPQNTYAVRFFALADEKDLNQVYSIWISVIPLDANGQNDGRTEFIFSINDTPQKIRDYMSAYFANYNS